MTTDGSFIYLALGFVPKGELMKIGTGLKGTIAGKIYKSVSLHFDGDLALVYCNHKLYMRKSDL